MTFAIIEYGSKQYKVALNDEIYIDKAEGKEGDAIVFDKVLMIDNNIGTPYLSGSKVSGQILKQGREPKLLIIKHRSQKHYNRRLGHRQDYTKVKITNIA